jgi:hypothetical protein
MTTTPNKPAAEIPERLHDDTLRAPVPAIAPAAVHCAVVYDGRTERALVL